MAREEGLRGEREKKEEKGISREHSRLTDTKGER